MRIAWLVTLGLVAVACGKSSHDSSSSSPIAVSFEGKQVEKVLHVTLTTEPRLRLFTSVQRGTINWLKAGGTEAWADDQGKAEFEIRDAYGDNALEVTATNAESVSLGTRTTKHTFKFAIVAPQKIDVTISDSAPEAPESERLEECEGAFQADDSIDAPRMPICMGGLRLGPDFTVGLAVKSASGKTLKIGDRTLELKDGAIEARIDLKPAMAAITLKALKGQERPFVYPVTFVSASGTRKGNIELGRHAVLAFLARVAKGPVLFPNEKPTAGHKASALVLSWDSLDWNYLGADVPLSNLDLVAVLRPTPRKGSPCAYEATDGSHERKTLQRQVHDITATIYDRRSGKQLATRAYPVKMPACEEWITSKDSGGFALIDEQEIVDWVETFVAKP